jgi:WD40 repeat protein
MTECTAESQASPAKIDKMIITRRPPVDCVGRTGGVAPPDGDRAASAGHDGTVRVWDLRTRKEMHRFTGHTGNVLTVAFAPDGNAVLSGGDDGTVRVWELTR